MAMRFSELADDLVLSPCRSLLSKLLPHPSTSANAHAAAAAASCAVDAPGGAALHSTIRTTHGFSARLDPHSHDGTVAPPPPPAAWDVLLRLASYGSEPPNMLVGLGPRLAHCDADAEADGASCADEDAGPPKETQSMFVRRVLSTPLVWEEPDFVFFECSDRGTFVWSDALHKYGEPLVAASSTGTAAGNGAPIKCFHYSVERQRWLAEVRLRWTPNATGGNETSMVAGAVGGTFQLEVSEPSCDVLHSENAMAPAQRQQCKEARGGERSAGKQQQQQRNWVRAASGVHGSIDQRLGVVPYVTMLNHVPSQVLVLPL